MSMLSRMAALGATRAQPSFVSSSTARVTTAGNTVTAPSSIQDGDLLVAVGFNLTNGLTVTPPTGFNVQHLDGTADNTVFIATKTAASESGNYTFTWSSAAGNSVAILVYRNATRVNTIGAIARATATTCAAASITPTYEGVLCVAFASEGASPSITTPPSTVTQRAVWPGSSGALVVYDLSPQAASATSTYTITWNANNANAALQFQVTNEPDVSPIFVASATKSNSALGTTLVINKPAGTVQDDLMIAVMAADAAGLWSGDTGWNEVVDQAADPNLRIAYKVAGASEGASYTFTNASSQTLSGCILTYRYAAYDTVAGTHVTGANPLILTSISPSLSQSILIACGARSSASITLGTPTSMTARVTDSDANDPSYIVCDQAVAKGPVGTRSMSTGITTTVSGIMLAIKPTRSL